MRQKADENSNPECIIINLKNGNSVMKRPIKADSAIMHCKSILRSNGMASIG